MGGFSFNPALLERSNVEYWEILQGHIDKYGVDFISEKLLDKTNKWIIGIFKRECDKLLESKDKKELGYQLATSLAEFLTKVGDLSNGEKLLNRALRLGRKMWPNQVDFPHKLSNQIRKGTIRRDLEDFTSALEIFENVRESYDKLGVARDDVRRSEVALQQGIVYRLTGRLDEAFTKLNFAIEIREAKLGLTETSNSEYITELGNCYFANEDYEQAADAFLKSSELIEQYNELDLAYLMNKLGRIYYLLKDFKSSIGFYERAMLLTISVHEPPEKDIQEIQSALNESKFKLKIEEAKAEHAKRKLEKEQQRAEKLRKREEKRLLGTLKRNETEIFVN